MTVRLEDIKRCFQGIIPCALATCARDGTPNITILSQVTYVDSRHVAVSCQFFNKTRRNIDENPFARVELWDPVSFEAYDLGLKYVKSETEGPLFDAMAARIQVIASHTGMAGVFRLRSADVFEVLFAKKVEGFLDERPLGASCPEPVVAGPLNELRALSLVSCRVNRAKDLDDLLNDVLLALDELFRFRHSMILLLEEGSGTLVTIASHGYGASGVGAEVPIGVGVIGTVAEHRAPLRLMGVEALLRYGRAIRGRVAQLDGTSSLLPEVPLPGLPDAESQLALPLVVGDRLLGVLALESREPLAFADWHEAFLEVIANQVAIGIDRFAESPEADGEAAPTRSAPQAASTRPKRTFVFHQKDESVFVDGEYLVRNVPGKILWKLLLSHEREGRSEFGNRELRLDSSLGLPAYKDNLESRLVLLRKRLEERCPGVRLVPVRRGRFTFEVDFEVTLEERETPIPG
jgi:hypothetical protein